MMLALGIVGQNIINQGINDANNMEIPDVDTRVMSNIQTIG